MQKSHPIVILLSTFVFAFIFFFGLAMTYMTFAPFVPSVITSLFTSRPPVIYQLPLSPDRLVPFSNPEIIVRPYPMQDPIDPPYNATEAALNIIRIPKLNIAVPLVLSPSLKDTDVIESLKTGAALYPNGVKPGALGNAFISAHSTGEPWRGKYRFAFIRINELLAGDALHIDWKGARYSYRITKSEIITPTPEFRVISDRPVPTISLMACWPLWSTKQRMLIHAELTNVTQLVRPAAV